MEKYDKKFWQAALIRALRTVLQTALAALTAATVTDYINWSTVISSSLLAGVYSLLTSLGTGLPEVQQPQLPPHDGD